MSLYRGLKDSVNLEKLVGLWLISLLACGLLGNENFIDPFLTDIEQKLNTKGKQVTSVKQVKIGSKEGTK